MTTMELDAMRAELARTILTTEDRDLLEKIKRFIKRQAKKRDAKDETLEDKMTKEEILSDFTAACRELRMKHEGKIKLKTLEEAINEL